MVVAAVLMAVAVSVAPIEQVVDPNCQGLDVTIGGGDNVAANERRSLRELFRPRKSYSTLAVQLGAKAHSMPPPTSQAGTRYGAGSTAMATAALTIAALVIAVLVIAVLVIAAVVIAALASSQCWYAKCCE